MGQHAQQAWQHEEQVDLSAHVQLKNCIVQPTMRPTEHLRDDVVPHLDQQLVGVLVVVEVLGEAPPVGQGVERLEATALPHHDPQWPPHTQQECRLVGEAQPTRACPEGRLVRRMPLMLTSV